MKFPVIYVARDIERALGFHLPHKDFYIISNATPYAKKVFEYDPTSILLLPYENEQRDTQELLQDPKAVEFIDNIPNAHIVVFKNTAQIETICTQHNWPLLNPPAKLARQVEEKISQVKWLGPLRTYLPPHEITVCKNLTWNTEKPEPFIVQFNHAHSGDGTLFIKEETQLKELQAKFPEREVRKTNYIPGPVFTVNNIVTSERVLMGNVSYQITGLLPFTDNSFTTVGNDWALPHTLLSEKQKNLLVDIVQDVGKKLQNDGWRGLFGVDVIVLGETQELYLLEINARQPASTSYESRLQRRAREREGQIGITLFEAHIKALTDEQFRESIIPIKDGAQLLQRITGLIQKEKGVSELEALGHNVVVYDNSKMNSDLMRIQSKTALMSEHDSLNETGRKIAQILLQ